MASISSPGIGSGLDIKSIVSQLVALEKQPLVQLQTKAVGIQAKLSAFGQIQSQISNLSDQVTKLASTTGWSSMALTSTNNAAISGTASDSAAVTSFSMEVSQLAREQSVGSSSFIKDSPMGGGSLSIRLGRWTGTGFTSDPGGPTFAPGSAAAVNISVSATDTLTQIASKINSANAGVSATVLRDSSGERLLMRSSDTGEISGFRVQVTDDDTFNNDASNLSRLAFDPQVNSLGMGLTQAAKNTLATINGVAVTSNNNQFADTVAGVTLTANQVTTSAATIKVRKDTSAIRANINNFVSSYNALSGALTEMTKYDAAKKAAGTLQGDASAVGLQSAFRSLVGSAGPSGTSFGRLSDIGLEMQADGTLKVNETKLTSALDKRDDLKQFFSTVSSVGVNGLAVRIKDFASGLLGASGSLTSKSKSLQQQVSTNSKEQERVQERIAMRESRLLAQYNRLDTNVAKLNALNSYVAQQVTTWNKQNSN